MESLFLMITSEMTTSASVPSPAHRRNITPVISLPDNRQRARKKEPNMIILVDRSRHGVNQ